MSILGQMMSLQPDQTRMSIAGKTFNYTGGVELAYKVGFNDARYKAELLVMDTNALMKSALKHLHGVINADSPDFYLGDNIDYIENVIAALEKQVN